MFPVKPNPLRDMKMEKEKLLGRKEDQAQKVLDALFEHVVYHDMQLKVLWANRAACRSVNLPLEELVGCHCYEVWSGRSTPCEDCPVIKSMESGKPEVVEKQTPDGRFWRLAGSPVLDDNGEIAAMVELTLDITDRVQAEMSLKKALEEREKIVRERTRDLESANERLKEEIEKRRRKDRALRSSELRFRKVFEHSATGIAIVDWDGNYRHCNPAYCALLGFTEEELRGIDYRSLFHPEDREANLLEIGRLQSGKISFFKFENRYVRKDGSTVWAHKVVSVLPGETGMSGSMIALVNDITSEKVAEEQLRELNKRLVERTRIAEQRASEIKRLAWELSEAEDRERRRLASVLHDDFQQMLAYLKLKLRSTFESVEFKDDLENLSGIIDECIGTCRNLANDLMPFSSLRNDRRDLRGALMHLARRMEEMYGLEVKLQVPDGLEISSDTILSMLLRSVREILFNVVKHSGQKCASLHVDMDNDKIRVQIADRGRGCDRSTIKGKQDGDKSFGLSSIEDRFKILGGSMEIESKPGIGFRLSLFVPGELARPGKNRRRNAAAGFPCESNGGMHAPAGSASKNRAPVRVLVVDDHDLIRDGLTKLLTGEDGIEVVGMAVNGRQACELTARLKPDIVLMDINMPVLNGIEATAKIKKMSPETKILGLTMYADAVANQEMLGAGAFECLTKDSPTEVLLKTIREANSG